MISGFEKYFQIARCFRDEDLRVDRQPEFTQIDIEMSFIEQEDIIKLIEEMYKTLFKEIENVDITTPFPRMEYRDAIKFYGSDKPDTRFDMKIIDFTDAFKETQIRALKRDETKKVLGLVIENGATLSRGEIEKLKEDVKQFDLEGFVEFKVKDGDFTSQYAKFLTPTEKTALLEKAQENSLITLFLVDRKKGYESVGRARLYFGNKFNLINKEPMEFPLGC